MTSEDDPGRVLNRRRSRLSGIEYHGVAGSSADCRNAVVRLLQTDRPIARARILTSANAHCLLLEDAIGDLIAVKSGFASGYGGEGPSAFSFTLELLDQHEVEIEEHAVDAGVIERCDESRLTRSDVERIKASPPMRPNRWYDYVSEADEERGRQGTLWVDFPQIVPFAVIDPRLMDLARTFWTSPDAKLLAGYRRLEDTVRARTGLKEHGAQLFSAAFQGKRRVLTWKAEDEGERQGRANLFASVFMAFRNPRAHRENVGAELLCEFLLLNQLFRLEGEAVETELDESGDVAADLSSRQTTGLAW